MIKVRKDKGIEVTGKKKAMEVELSSETQCSKEEEAWLGTSRSL